MMSSIRAVPALMLTALLFIVAAPASAVTPGAEHMTVYDSNEEIEPALISQSRSGVDYVVTVYMKFHPTIASSQSTLEYAAYNSNGSSTNGVLPMTTEVASYSSFADPVLAQDEAGTSPRIYLAAIGKSGNSSALIIWTSDSGGWYWSTPHIIESQGALSAVIDKPAITVGPDGLVHVTYLRLDQSVVNASATLWYRLGTYDPVWDIWGWSDPTNVVGTGNFASPQVMVDVGPYPDVYILYVDGNENSIHLVRDDGSVSGFSFNQVGTIPNTGRLYGFLRDEFVTLTPTVSVRAITVPVARLDRTNRRIAAAWHEGDGEGHSRIRFASLETDGTRTWTNPLIIAAAGGHDINVGMAKDDFGKWLVTYYSFPSNASTYSPVGTTVYFIGDTPMHDNGNNTIIGRLGDVADYSRYPADGYQRYIGEYHDVSYSLGTFKSVHIIVAPIGNPYIFEATQ
jgi:hypothetical protein